MTTAAVRASPLSLIAALQASQNTAEQVFSLEPLSLPGVDCRADP